MRRALIGVLCVFVWALFVVSSVAVAATPDVRGTWSCCGAGGAGAQTWVITSASGTGKGSGGGSTWPMHGSVSGTSVSLTTGPYYNLPDYTAVLVGTFSKSGNTMSGTWSDTYGAHGTWTATRSGGSKKQEQASISGSVGETDCSASGCSLKGLPGVAITVSGGPGGTARTSTGTDGSYSLKVDKGSWTVTPSLAGRVFDPVSAAVNVQGDTAGVSFTTCAAARKTQSIRARARMAGVACPKLDVTIVRINAGGDHGWTQTSGKKYLNKDGKHTYVPVGFGEPAKNGDFHWQCLSGCFNIRVQVRDAKTHRPPPDLALANVNILFLGHSVDPLDANGALCRADRPRLSYGCSGATLKADVNQKTGNLDLYYWVPGVVPAAKPSDAILNVEITSDGYPVAKAKTSLTIEPNVAFESKTVTFRHASLDAIRHVVPVLIVGNVLNVASYCGWFVTISNAIVSRLFDIGIPDGYKNFFTDVVGVSKLVKAACSAFDLVDVLGDIKKAAAWSLYWYFGGQLGFPPSGLVGPPTLVSFLRQVAFEYSEFFDAFTGGLRSFYLDTASLLAPNQVGVDAGDTLKLTIYEVSHRRANGALQDALYLVFTGTKHGTNGMRDITPITNYVEDGYLPACWLNPKLNQQQVIVVDSACVSEEEAPH